MDHYHHSPHISSNENEVTERHTRHLAVLRSLFQRYSQWRDDNSNKKRTTSSSEEEEIIMHMKNCIEEEMHLQTLTMSMHIDKLTKLTRFFQHLYSFKLESSAHSQRASPQSRVVVVGAGPVGLMSALESSFYSHVTIVEKRRNYTRNVWFDFYPKPYSVASEFLMRLGLKYQNVEYQSIPIQIAKIKGDVILIRCQILERFLSKILWIYGVEMLYGFEYRNHTDSHVNIVETVGTTQRFHNLPFDILIGADGSTSQVRKIAGIATQTVESFQALPIEEHVASRVHVKGLHQTALVINLSPVFNSTTNKFECPLVRTDPKTNQPIDPWSPTFEVKGVTSIFKRFYYDHCHLQVLFEHEFGDQIIKTYRKEMEKRASNSDMSLTTVKMKDHMDVFFAVENPGNNDHGNHSQHVLNWELEAYPWSSLLAIMQNILSDPPKNVQELIHMIQHRATTPFKGKLDMTLWNVVINRATESFKLIDNGRRAIILHGDAVSTAHFRLGVGVNNAFISYGEVFAPYLLGRESWEQIMARQNRRWDSLINYMTSTMFWEAYCNYVVFFNTGADSGWQSNGDDHLNTVWYRVSEDKSFEQFDTIDGMINSCHNKNNWYVLKELA